MLRKLFFQRLRYEIAMCTGLGLADGLAGGFKALASGEQDPEKLADLIRQFVEERLSTVETPKPTFEVTIENAAPKLLANESEIRRGPGRPPRKYPLDGNNGEPQS